MKIKKIYVIQNSKGKFFKFDTLTGGYPCFIDDFEFCERYKSKEDAEEFINSDYVAMMFKNEFKNCIVRTVKITLE